MAGYDFAAVEAKWQKVWADSGTFVQPNPNQKGFVERPKFYILDMFPYPSGAGLHLGHVENYSASDILARFRRMNGYNVLYSTGYDAFGLPAQQYAMEHGVHPRQSTEQNMANIERQVRSLGLSYDVRRRIATIDPDYYRWTQWIFLRIYNSWYDEEANAARPIEQLIQKLKAEGLSGQALRRAIDERRLAYMAEVPVNWCPMLGTVLANEEVTNEGRSDRGDHPVYQRDLKQWMLRITAYTERLLGELETVDWPEPIKVMQRNWIGKSTGAELDFPLASVATDAWFEARRASGYPAQEEQGVIRVYTTRPDTLFGATYMVLAPEHPLVAQITTAEHRDAVDTYVKAAARKSELERMAETKQKTGVFTGAYAVNPVNHERMPIWVADYVMMGYGTGAIMAVPAHDTRDLEFARAFDLPVVQVVQPPEGIDWEGYVDEGTAVNSGKYDGLPTGHFIQRITGDLEAAGLGRFAVNYKLRDWIFSRQWYWGEPFPIVHCEKCGTVGLPDDDLPLRLPDMEDFEPETSDDPDTPPQPPLGRLSQWVQTTCPDCGRPARRETNAMPQWAGSCWYYLRYLDPKNDKTFCDAGMEKYWMAPCAHNSAGGVDLYIGGAEHAVLHLLYARFWHKVLYDLGHVSTPEPFGRLFNQGLILSQAYRDGRGVYLAYDDVDRSGDKPVHRRTGEALVASVEKMSKSLKNVVEPDEVISQYGADTLRLYEMFMGPLSAAKPWNSRDIPGVHRFLQRVWRMMVGDEDNRPLLGEPGDPAVEKALHKLVKKVGEDYEALKFNTALAAMMEFVNAVFKAGKIAAAQAGRFVLLLSPMAPHIAEELWQRLGHETSLAQEPWPTYDQAMIAEETLELPVQVNGKMRGRISVAADADEDAIVAAALADEKVARFTEGKKVVKKIVVPGRLVNLVVK